eukprot:gene7269-26498_t
MSASAAVQGRVCPKGHALAAFRTDVDGYTCDVCGPDVSMPKGTLMHGCRVCDHDVCAACVAEAEWRVQWHAPPGMPMHHEGLWHGEWLPCRGAVFVDTDGDRNEFHARDGVLYYTPQGRDPLPAPTLRYDVATKRLDAAGWVMELKEEGAELRDLLT